MSYQLRDYQQGAVNAALSSIDRGQNGILVLPTGSGKSLIIAGIATALDCRILVLQPTKEILEQNLRKLWEFGHQDVAAFSASVGSKRRAQVTFGTIGSVINRRDEFDDVDLIVVDECHLVNAKAGMYQELIKSLGVPTVGLTATPYRMHASFSGAVVEAKFLHRTRPRVFDSVKCVVQNADLHEQGWLAPIKYYEDRDYDPYSIALKSTGLNYDESSLAAYNKSQETTRKIADVVVNNHDSVSHFLAFVSSIDESQDVERLLAKSGVSVAHIDGKTPKGQREKILTTFQGGGLKVVTNVGVLTTGFDFPALDGIILGRPTMSLPLYYQMVGRGVRCADGKANCEVFDLCGNIGRFGRPDEYVIEAPDQYKYRLRSGKTYLTGRNFVTGRDLEKQRERRAKKKSANRATVTFGKHKGKKLADVPKDYLEWCVGNFSDDSWKATFSTELKRRAEASHVANLA